MNTDALLKNFDAIASSRGGVGQLRKTILQLAFTGQLIDSDPADSSAAELLNHAIEVKSELVEAGAVPKPRRLTEQAVDTHPFDIPPGWIWARLDDLAVYIQRGKGPKYVELSNVPVVSQKCVQWSGFDLSRARFVDEATLSTYKPERFLEAGDLLWNSTGTGTVGRVNVYPGSKEFEAVVADSHVTVIRTKVCSSNFLTYWLSSPAVQSTIEEITTGSTNQQELNTQTIRQQPVPLPPIEEQSRIVDKVDELMQLCASLQASQDARHYARNDLRSSSIRALVEAGDREEQEVAWKRIDSYWGVLTQDTPAVAELRNAVIEMGIRGKLSNRIATDEPVAATIERCSSEKLRLLESGIVRKQASLSRPLEERFRLPDGWVWKQMDECFLVTGGITKSTKRSPSGNAFPYLRVANVQRGRLDLDEISHLELFDGEIDRYRLEQGDLLVVEGNGSEKEIGRCARWSGEIETCVHQNHLIRCRPLESGLEHFVLLYLNSPSGVELMKTLAVTTSGLFNLSVGKIRAISVPVPPLEERERIVESVDQLLSACDDLHTSIGARVASEQALVEAMTSLEELPRSLSR